MQALVAELAQAMSPLGAEARAAARALVCDVFGLTPTALALAYDRRVTQAEADNLLSMARRVAAGEPLQYVTGVCPFAGLELKVGPGALIPRPETEGLLDLATQWADGRRGLKALDVGTGSGCIALALASTLSEPNVLAIDASDDALAIAQANAARLSLPVTLRKVDILSLAAEALATTDGPFDLVVSNPPYVRDSERATMAPNVLDHEPALALFVPDSDPLLFYRRIGHLCAGGLLRQGGALLFEINEALGAEMADLLRGQGFAKVQILPDFTGRDRFATAIRP